MVHCRIVWYLLLHNNSIRLLVGTLRSEGNLFCVKVSKVINTFVTNSESMEKQGRIPCTVEDGKQFKIKAATLGKSMKDLFHEWMKRDGQDGDIE
jgi:hypothetical protein